MPRRDARRRALSLTPLVDVIFLLLLFFMLTSTFSRYGEIEISAAAGGGSGEALTDAAFLQLGPERILLAGREVALEELPGRLEDRRALIALRDGVDAQRLVDVLGVLRDVPGLNLTVLQ
ncbi:MAG: biopolymer transporter ExbD [Pseudomonadota bacterium]